MIKIAAVLGGGCLMVVIIASLKKVGVAQPMLIKNPDLGLVKNLGKVLFNEFLLPFEVSSLLLLSAMVGAVLLATKDKKTTA
jgi:NADH-quinone oxidoreductase subunit J